MRSGCVLALTALSRVLVVQVRIKKNPDRCLPLAKAKSMTKSERAKTARKKKRAGRKGETVVANTKAGRVTKKYTTR